MRIELSRREFFSGAGLFACSFLGIYLWRRFLPLIPARWAPQLSAKIGHRLLTKDFPPPSSFEKRDVVIVGGGVSGLSAARFLKRSGHLDFELLELEAQVGGNGIWGENSISRYPWAAHYLPLPRLANKALLQFLEEIGVVTGWSSSGLPIYDELVACHAPQERIFDGKRWCSGLLPEHLMTEEDRLQIDGFLRLMESFEKRVGQDGRRAFTIPVDESSKDSEFLAFDQISMAEFLRKKGFTSQVLKWMVDYSTRDDFGTKSEETSAWAGIHYFSARGGVAENLEAHSVLTWPEGNGWLIERLRAGLDQQLSSSELVFDIVNHEDKVIVRTFNSRTQKTREIECAQVIYSAPRYTAFSVIQKYAEEFADLKSKFHYAPWMVANVSLDGEPASHHLAPLSWDNVRYQSPMLGYVHANHQDLERIHKASVLTLYWPLTEQGPEETRRWARSRSLGDWKQDILRELELMHPGISNQVQDIQVKVWGHGMIQPRVGFFTRTRPEAAKSYGRVIFAHTDMSGISIFEEGFEQGRKAAERVGRQLS